MAKIIKPLTDKQAAEAGAALAELLYLKKERKSGRYRTTWGTKSALGLYRTIERFLVERMYKEI